MKYWLILTCTVLVGLIGACVKEEISEAPEANPNLSRTEEYTSGCPLENAVDSLIIGEDPSSSNNEVSYTNTRIRVDGMDDDWTNRPITSIYSSGNAEDTDHTPIKGYSFVNKHALYLLINGPDANRSFHSFELNIEVESNLLRLVWTPDSEKTRIINITNEEGISYEAEFSSFAIGPNLETRIDFRDIGSIESEQILGISFRIQECCDYTSQIVESRALCTHIRIVDEVDLPWRLALQGSAEQLKRDLSSPDIRLISLDYNFRTGRVKVTGAPGAVPDNSFLLIGNLEPNNYTMLRANPYGEFETEVTASPGTHVIIKQDTTGRFIKENIEETIEEIIAPGVIIRIPVKPVEKGIPFGAGSRVCCDDEHSVPWTIVGSFEQSKLIPGNTLHISGHVSLTTDRLIREPHIYLDFSISLLSDANGRQVGRAGKFVTPFLTATDLPIERTLGGPLLSSFHIGNIDLDWNLSNSIWTARFESELQIPKEVRAGIYTLTTGAVLDSDDVILQSTELRSIALPVRDHSAFLATLGALTIGNPKPMRLATTLLADEISEGSRGGVLALEDKGMFDISPRVVTRHDPIIPRLDGYGQPWDYRLEPYTPMIDVVDRVISTPPAILLDLSHSQLTISVTRPDYQIEILGPAPLTKLAVKSPRTPWGDILGRGGGELREIPQLQGDGDVFSYQFPMDGDYVITLDGYVNDLEGRVYQISGTYDVTVANILDIETALLPTTPFEVNDSIPIAVTIMPGHPAKVTYNVLHITAEGHVTRKTFKGQANTYGWWDGDGASFKFNKDGEYRIDIEARFSDDADNLWAGRLRFGSVVATPNPPFIAHGRRGPDRQKKISPPWAFESFFEFADTSHMHYPYFTGDILWGIPQPEGGLFMAGDAVITHMSIQPINHLHPLINRVISQTKQLANEKEWLFEHPFEDMLRAGELPLFTTATGETNQQGIHPDEIDMWAYMYSSAQRPGVRVREVIQSDDVPGSYWRLDDAYHAQSGNGPAGDLPGDFKFMYGAAVIHDKSAGEGIYAIYGSGWVHAPVDDPLGARFFPPFRGAAGGPDGGPLFLNHGREINIFFLPLGVRPGAILETGDIFRLAGPIMPTLASHINYTVIAPDGSSRTFNGQANSIGYFYNPAHDFTLDQTGLWSVELSVTHQGMTSAGIVESPYPTGGTLTPNGTTFTFVVIDNETHLLEIQTDLKNFDPSDWYSDVNQVSFYGQLPNDWNHNIAHVTVTMPGIVLIDQNIPVSNGKIKWDLNAEKLNQLASNFDYESGIADTITVTFYSEDGPKRAAGHFLTHGAKYPKVSTNRQ